MKRRRFLQGAGALGLTGLTGYLGSTQPAANVGMVYALGGLGDKSFNDQAQRGVQQASEELGIAFQEAQPSRASEFSTFQRRFASSTNPNFDLICCIGFLQQSPLSETAPSFPDQRFMLVDAVVEEDNVSNFVFREEQGSFQVGHLAGLLTTESFDAGAGSTNPDVSRVGFVGGVEAPLIRKFQAGYEAGVAFVNEDIEVNVAYTGSFSDPTAGKEAAVSMYDDGADIVYHAAGGTGIGVFQAAQEQGRYAIGVDSDQSQSEPMFADVILASMVKRVDTAVFTAIESVVNDAFQSGVNTLGLEDDGIEAVFGSELGPEIPEEFKTALDESRTAIIEGEIEVPTEPAE